MQRIRAVVRNFVLPVAGFAGSAWAFVFVFAYIAQPKHDLGFALLFVFAGIVMSLPWIVIALGVLQRMRQNARESEGEDRDPGDAR